MQPNKHKKLIIAIIIALLVCILIVSVILYIKDRDKTATLSPTIAPSFAQLTIDGQTYPTNSESRLKPGEYTATISADGFRTLEINITLTDHETTSIYQYLEPNDGDLSWYYNRPRENNLFNIITQAQATEYAQEMLTKYPITNMLPLNVVEVDPTTYDWTEYRIDCGYFEECKNPDFCIKITDTTGGNREKALQKIRDGGFNPNDYEIIYEYVPVVPLN